MPAEVTEPGEDDVGGADGLLGTARGRLVAELCGAGMTAGELAARVGTSGSAVRVQLEALRRDGLVRYQRARRGVGKPAHVYELTAAAEYLLSRAYAPAVGALVTILGSEPNGETLIHRAGVRLALASEATGDGRDGRLAAAVSLLRRLGGNARVMNGASHEPEIVSDCCPLAAASRDAPLSCKLLEAMVQEVVGRRVVERCDRDGRPHCRFVLRTAASEQRA